MKEGLGSAPLFNSQTRETQPELRVSRDWEEDGTHIPPPLLL